jgi:DnaJ family protein C protein 7
MDVKQTLKYCPNLVPAKILYIEVLAKKNQTKEAIEKSSEFLSELSGNLDYLYVRGLALYYDGQTENAKKIWRHLLQMDPDDQRCKEAIKRMNRQEEAKEKGNTAFKDGDYETAEKYYTEGINQDPKNKNLVSQLYLNRSTLS